MWPAAWAPIPADTARGMKARPVASGPMSSTFCRVERSEQEQAEDRTRSGEHQEEAATNSTIRQSLDT